MTEPWVEKKITVRRTSYRYEVEEGDDAAFVTIAYFDDGEIGQPHQSVTIAITDAQAIVDALEDVSRHILNREAKQLRSASGSAEPGSLEGEG